MNFIITGAAGFIGSHLTAKLLALHHRVIAIDNLSTGFLHNLDLVKDHPNLTVVVADVQQLTDWEQYAIQGDVIVHLAATVGVKKVCADAHDTLTNNLDSTAAILDVAGRKKCKVFFASTSEVYGQSDKGHLSETDALSVYTTDQGRSSYVISKLTNEISCLNSHQLKSVPVIIGRFFNVTGGNQKSEFGMVIPTFINNAMAGTAITLYNDGSQRRSFCYIDDLLRAIVDLIAEPGAWGNIFNIGSDTSITIKELAEYIRMKCNSASEIVNTPMPPERAAKSEVYSRLPSLEKIYEFIQWKPEVHWQDSVAMIIEKKEKDLRGEML
ncbi:NAD-dependent epimerase/dehydratase family protein [Pedobacter gandavensis]|uniref:NAD-dependent epimerase/dehydratase family protein n=1 Tax=Pedobacter gandavensis TaxID=2679963 RepID=UPI0029310ECB|nr:NAD-dependent epimerase/dehydratase family protein [Pedobacter gandavensis]